MHDPKEVLELYGKAAPGPWDPEFRDFITIARIALPEFAERVIELEADNAKLRAIAEVAQELRRAWEDEVDRDTEAEFAGELIQALADAGYGR